MMLVAVRDRSGKSRGQLSRSWGTSLVALLTVVLLSALACSKKSESFSPVPLGVKPDFATDTPTVSSMYVSLRKSDVEGEHITLDVVVTDVAEPVSGIALKISFPGDMARFESCSDGDLLPSGQCYATLPALGSGEVFIGRTIVNPQQPVTVVGSRTIVRLRFLVFAQGGGDNTRIRFEGQNLGGGDASALLDASGNPILVSWFAGILLGL